MPEGSQRHAYEEVLDRMRANAEEIEGMPVSGTGDHYESPQISRTDFENIYPPAEQRVEEANLRASVSDDRIKHYFSGYFDEYFFKKAQETIGEEVGEYLMKLELLKQNEDANVGDYIQMLSEADAFFDKVDISYDDWPTADGGYVYVLSEAFLPALEVFEERFSAGDDSEEAMQALTKYVADNYCYNDYYMNRAQEICSTLANVGGINSFDYMEHVHHSIVTTPDPYGGISDKVEQGVSLVEWALGDDEYSFDSPSLYFSEDFESAFRLHAWIVHKVAEVGNQGYEDEAAKFLSEFVSHDSRGTVKDYTEAFESLGAEVFAPYLLENLKSEDTLTRRMSAEILYRLELGKIGITSKEGVEYFDKVYQLVKEGDPDFYVRLFREGDAYVRRVDCSGSVGVFNSDERLLGRFKLDLMSDESVIQATVNELSSKDIFIKKADETPEERRLREAFLEMFLVGYGELYEEVKRETGVNLNSLELHEQGWFVTYYSTADQEQRDSLMKFVGRYDELGLKTFLALDYGESGDEILRYAAGSKATESDQRKVFSNYYGIANRAMEWRKVFESVEAQVGCEFASEVHEGLLRKASEYFRAALIIDNGEGGDVTRDELMEGMGSVSYALGVLEGLYKEDSELVLVGDPQVQAEYIDPEGTDLAEDARTTWILNDNKGNRVVVSVRRQPTYKVGNRPGGEARINFKVTNAEKGIEARIGLDLSDYGEVVGESGKKPVVSLDLGTGIPDREAGVWPSQRVGRVLELVPKSEGGHNEASFSTEAAKEFTDIARRFTDYMEKRYEASVARDYAGSLAV